MDKTKDDAVLEYAKRQVAHLYIRPLLCSYCSNLITEDDKSVYTTYLNNWENEDIKSPCCIRCLYKKLNPCRKDAV
jgi:hypothetical protein